MFENFSYVRALSQIGTTIQLFMRGSFVGTDEMGNRYYVEKKSSQGRRLRRWVMYCGEPEASKVPPSWHGWLHYTSSAPLTQESPFHRDGQVAHKANASGTPDAYLPKGHVLSSAQRLAAIGDYQAWKP